MINWISVEEQPMPLRDVRNTKRYLIFANYDRLNNAVFDAYKHEEDHNYYICSDWDCEYEKLSSFFTVTHWAEVNEP